MNDTNATNANEFLKSVHCKSFNLSIQHCYYLMYLYPVCDFHMQGIPSRIELRCRVLL
jgi:hypothetical protein